MSEFCSAIGKDIDDRYFIKNNCKIVSNVLEWSF